MRYGLILFVWVWAAQTLAATPNVVLILSDDQKWTDYGFMGHPQIQTPNLDRLAAEGLRFTHGYVPSSLCRPSLMSIISGLYPHQHHITGNDQRGVARSDREPLTRFVDQAPLLPKLLGAQDYVSLQAGKWWEGNYRRGGFTRGMTQGDAKRGGRHGDLGLKIGREGMQPVFSFIDQAVADQKPFFVWFAPMMPHDPHTPPERLLKKYQTRTPSIHVARYWAMCEWFDETCGQLIDYLKEKRIEKDTIVLYVCDNGWIQDPQRSSYAPRSKRSPYDGGIRTPILVRWPGTIAPARIETPVSSLDLAPTILRAVGQTPPAAMSGIDLCDEQAIAARKAIFGEIFDHDVAELGNPAASLQSRWSIAWPWKLIVPHDATQSVELYNLAADPHEQHDQSAAEPLRVAELRALVDAWWRP